MTIVLCSLDISQNPWSKIWFSFIALKISWSKYPASFNVVICTKNEIQYIWNTLWKYNHYIQRSILRLWKEMCHVPENRCQSPRTSSYLRLLISNVSKFLSTSSSSLSFFIWKCKRCAYADDDMKTWSDNIACKYNYGISIMNTYPSQDFI